ncbi:MAG: hypothetical protein LBC43_03465 [Bifidobacteriaceae bacterium]|jgi:hypothetical protein|nr:hypothetical protein [Bifidobacteriaceae bacterium]
MPRKHPPRINVTPFDETVFNATKRIEVKRGHRYEIHYSRNSSHPYRCAGCNREIPSGSNTFTVIDLDHILGVQAGIDERRHWHPDCWRLFR